MAVILQNFLGVEIYEIYNTYIIHSFGITRLYVLHVQNHIQEYSKKLWILISLFTLISPENFYYVTMT